MRRIALVLCMALLGAEPGCRQPAPPNVLLVSLDTLRADRLSTYGHSRDTSPFLTELARRGTRFERASVNAQGTAPSHATILSGLYQQTHDVGMGGASSYRLWKIPEQVELIQQRFREAGYTTIGVTDGGWMLASVGFGRGFDAFSDAGGGVDSGTLEMLRMFDAAPPDRPIFAFYHTYEIHSPYATPEPAASRYGRYGSRFEPDSAQLLRVNRGEVALSGADREWIGSAYDAGIRYTDDRLRVFFDELEARGRLENTLVVITSDHGEELGDHGRYLHEGHHHVELMHVPLVFVGPGVPSGSVDDRLVSSIDIAPTLLALAGLEIPAHMPGRVLFGSRTGWEDRAVLAQTNRHRWSLRTPRWKLMESGRGARQQTLLFDLENDPGERFDVAADHPDVVARLQEELRARRAAVAGPLTSTAESTRLDDAQIGRLRALGYLEEAEGDPGGEPEPASPGPDQGGG